MILAAILVLGTGQAAGADRPLQSLESIKEATRRFVTENMGVPGDTTRVTVGRLDPRLRLAKCGSKLEAAFQSNAHRISNTTVRVACPGPKPWSLYVPVAVKRYDQVVVLARPVAPGATLTAQDVRLDERSIDGLVSGYFSDPQQVIGKQMRRSMTVGQTLPRLAVLTPKLVSRGERVTFTSGLRGLQVRMEGTILMDAAIGDRVRVRNDRSKRIVEGILAADRTVRVRM